jgi:hypothetical protein
MKTFQVARYGLGRNSTLGYFSRITNDAREEICFTLEDERRYTKVYGETCIPVGTYELRLRTEGDMHQDYRRRFGDRHKGMIWLQDVPDFTFVYIHILNYEYQTKGCIGVGEVPAIYPDGEFWVGRSESAYWRVYDEIVPALIAGEKVVLHVTEVQPWA